MSIPVPVPILYHASATSCSVSAPSSSPLVLHSSYLPFFFCFFLLFDLCVCVCVCVLLVPVYNTNVSKSVYRDSAATFNTSSMQVISVEFVQSYFRIPHNLPLPPLVFFLESRSVSSGDIPLSLSLISYDLIRQQSATCLPFFLSQSKV